MTKPMRSAMPNVTRFIDDMREAFGNEMIDRQIRKGMNGEQGFYAKEGGHTIGTPLIPVDGVKLSETFVGRMFPPDAFNRRAGKTK